MENTVTDFDLDGNFIVHAIEGVVGISKNQVFLYGNREGPIEMEEFEIDFQVVMTIMGGTKHLFFI